MKKAVCLIVALIALANCNTGHASLHCSDITALREQVGSEFSIEECRSWVSETYNVPIGGITEKIFQKGLVQANAIQWKKGNSSFLIGLAERKLYSVDIAESGIGQGTAGDVISCLGEPYAYRAHYEWAVHANELELDLLYPGQGIEAKGVRFLRTRPEQPPSIDERFPVYRFRLVEPGTVEEVILQIYGSDSDASQQVIAQYKPWPGSWERIDVEIAPGLLRVKE